MPIPRKYLADFEEECTYHIYNRTNNKEKLFLSNENRIFFLRKYHEHLSGLVDTFCWVLLSNHFHLLIRIKSRKQLISWIEQKNLKEQTLAEKKYIDQIFSARELIGHAFKRFFQSYTQAFNNMFGRHGNLFYRPFKRVAINKAAQLTQAIIYIHANPVKHGIVSDFENYEWSSWKDLISARPSLLIQKEVLDWFGGKENMIREHRELIKFYLKSDISIEK